MSALDARLTLPVAIATLVLLGLGALVSPASAFGQECESEGGCSVPTVTITPAGGSYRSAAVSVTIFWSSPDVEMDPSTRSIWLNGIDVTASFSHSGNSYSARSSATISLSPGANELNGVICDTDGYCGEGVALYTYDRTPPSIALTPNGGYTSNPSPPVTIEWSDDMSLNPVTWSIRLDEVDVTDHFDYRGSGTSARSTGTINLENSDVLTVSICDRAGNCASAEATFTFDPLPPTVSITPSEGDYASASRPVTITWSDDWALNDGSRSITLNGTNVAGSFGYSGGGSGPAQSSGTITLSRGSNTLTARICDLAGNCNSRSATYFVDNSPPGVSFSPPGGGTYGSHSLPVTITWDDDYQLNADSDTVWLNGGRLTSLSGDIGTKSGTTSGTITLSPGGNTLAAKICDLAGSCTTRSAAYTYDNVAPSVTLTPGGGYFSSASRAVTIDWAENIALDTLSRTITLNGASVDGRFTHTWAANSGQSQGTIMLAEGSNTVSVRICDTFGNCTTKSASFVYDGLAPSVEISPRGGTYTGSSRFVTIDWKDNYSLNGSSQTFTLNGTSLNPNGFAITGGGLSAQSQGTLTLASGKNTFTARICDSAGHCAENSVSYVFDSAAQPKAPVVTLTEVNPGTTIERDLCLTVAMGATAAAECGDLRLVHELPTTRTLDKTRTPALLYNSQHAAPYPLVAANVTLPAGGSSPDSVVAVLKTGTSVRARTRWEGSDWTDGRASRIVLGYAESATAPTIVSYTVEVTNWYGATAYIAPTASGQVVVIDRTNSPFGAGWWLAGLEELIIGNKLWVGGDGSTRRYLYVRTVGQDTVWAAPNVDRPDTLKWIHAQGRFIRYLPGGVQVKFDNTGRHRETVNRLGHVTAFYYSATQLDSIELPVPRGAGPRVYRFAYDTISSIPRLRSIAAPGRQPIALSHSASTSRRVSKIQGPDTTSVRFGYDGSTNRILTRTDRRGTVAGYAYDAGKRVSQVKVDTAGLKITTKLRALESLGLSPVAVDTAKAYALLDGPRTDVGDTTAFWLDRFGAPSRVKNALGHETVLMRGHSTYPALVTRTRYPNGRVVAATYNARGRIETSTDSSTFRLEASGATTYATTRYEYTNAAWPDFATKITLPEGRITTIRYNAAGNRMAQWTGPDSARAVHFRYYESGRDSLLLRAVELPLTPPDSIAYDALGNLAATRTPLGFWTVLDKDWLGRDTLIIVPIDSVSARDPAQLRNKGAKKRIVYDLMDRVRETQSIGPDMAYMSPLDATPYFPSNTVPGDTLLVRNRYDPEGNLLEVFAWPKFNTGGPVLDGIGTLTEWTYDNAGRKQTESMDGPTESYSYDAAGNVKSVTTRSGHTITMRYDELNRLIERIVPAVTHPATNCGVHYYAGSICRMRFPLYPNNASGGLTIPADTQSYSYDAGGNQRTAHNRYARVTRTYHPSGLLESEEQRIRSYNGSDFDRHAYSLVYGYDLDGRRTRLEHPSNLAGGLATQSYGYDPQTGELSWITDVLGNRFDYFHDLQGRLDSLTTRAAGSSQVGTIERRTYDDDGRLRRRWAKSQSTGKTLYDDALTYDARGKTLSVTARGIFARAGTTTYHYSGQGHVIASDWQSSWNGGRLTEEFRTDALGSVMWKRTSDWESPTRSYNYSYGGSGQLDLMANDVVTTGNAIVNGPWPDTTYNYFDAAGNVVANGIRRYETASGISTLSDAVATLSFYGADQKLFVYQKYGDPQNPNRAGIYDEYRYDALGRRIMLRSRADSLCFAGCRSAIERYVWDGSQLLWELRFPGGDSLGGGEPDPLEYNTAGSHAHFGGVAYTHGPGIDAPLGLIRSSYSYGGPIAVVPHADWRGSYVSGTSPGGGDLSIEVDWPGAYRRLYHDEAELSRAWSSWFGSLIQGLRDQSGLVYMRNRYYDPNTGRFTQEDPIGLAGGLNLYGYAAGDPVNFSDPFGLRPDTVWVGVRALDDPFLGKLGNHAAIRVNGQVGELLNADGTKRIDVRSAEAEDLARYNWIRIDAPEGMSVQEFDAAVISSFNSRARAHGGRPYSFAGSRNSNRFIWEVLTGAGGSMPSAAKRLGPGLYTPGICGGASLDPLHAGFSCNR